MGYLGYKPADKPLTAADITDGIIVNADIANSTINLTTKVTGSLPVANGGTGLTALGTAAQELRVNSGATALEYYTPTVASSDFVLLATTDASSSASVSFDGYFSSTYKNYQILISNCCPATTNNTLALRFRRSNADITSSYNYYTNGGNSVDGTLNNNYTTSGSYISLNMVGIISNETTYNTSASVYLFDALGTNNYKNVLTSSCAKQSGGNWWYVANGNGILYDSTSALSGVSFSFTSGNITRGNFKLYGIK